MAWDNGKVELRPLTKHAEFLLKDVEKRIPFDHWVSGGTALGLYRGDGLIEGDTDIDFAAVGYDGIDKDLIQAMNGYELSLTRYKGQPMQMVFMKDDTIIDFYFHWEKNGYYVNYGGSHDQRVPCETYDNIKKLNTKLGEFPFPDPVEKYLESRYGDWRTPRYDKPTFAKDRTYFRDV